MKKSIEDQLKNTALLDSLTELIRQGTAPDNIRSSRNRAIVVFEKIIRRFTDG
jgi:hypothetical protein